MRVRDGEDVKSIDNILYRKDLPARMVYNRAVVAHFLRGQWYPVAGPQSAVGDAVHAVAESAPVRLLNASEGFRNRKGPVSRKRHDLPSSKA